MAFMVPHALYLTGPPLSYATPNPLFTGLPAHDFLFVLPIFPSVTKDFPLATHPA